jgi:KRAB domain-containing zinc finger protein
MEVITKIHTYICMASSIPLVLVCSEQQLPATPGTVAAAAELMMFGGQETAEQEELATPVTIVEARNLKTKIVSEGGSYTCAVCHTIVKGYKEFLSHRLKHKEAWRYKCPYAGCDYTAKKKRDLGLHEKEHKEERPYKCPYAGCDYAAKKKRDLELHERVHKEERPYKCPYAGCDYATRWKGNLKGHERTHTGERPYPCPKCDKKFTQKSALADHMKTHTGVRPYPCPECDKKFTKKSNLIVHKRKIHPEPIMTPGSQVAAQELMSLGDETDE